MCRQRLLFRRFGPDMMNQDEFDGLMGSITGAWAQRDFESAFSQLEAIVKRGSAEMKANALLFSGMIKESNKQLLDARQDWLEGIPHSPQGSFVRYNLQQNIGRSFENENSFAEAHKWYRAAIQTCANGGEFSGEKALVAYLSLHDGQIKDEDRNIFSVAVEKSWRILELPGRPSLDDLPKAVDKLTEHFETLVRDIVEDN